MTLSYRWLRNGTAIAGAEAPSYRLTPSDAGTTIRVEVTGTRAGYEPVSVLSVGSVVGKGVLSSATPTVKGTAKVGQRLTAVPGSWGPAPVSVRYQWLRGGVQITGATSATYVPVRADAGKKVSVRVTGLKPGYTTASKVSASMTVAR